MVQEILHNSHLTVSIQPASLHPHLRDRISLESYFNLQGDRSPNEYRAVYAAVDNLTVDRYRDYKLKAHNYLKAHGPNLPYNEMSTEDWQKCIDFTNPNFVERSTKNKANRGKAKYSSVHGSKSFSVMHYNGIQGTSPSLNSTAASKAPQGTFHQFSGYPQNDDSRFDMYEAQLRRMQREIEFLENSIPGVVLEEDEDEGLEAVDEGIFTFQQCADRNLPE
ncbi:Uncharacterized protein Adt_30406 [Abeliophyllum distichum]|uniref:Uncharacterized protein n=1 Tax=Abeliophyllum distichum TaxID=126358 RepID=A0ABD1RB74_9LAMI